MEMKSSAIEVRGGTVTTVTSIKRNHKYVVCVSEKDLRSHAERLRSVTLAEHRTLDFLSLGIVHENSSHWQ
jgi:hypothetical protein